MNPSTSGIAGADLERLADRYRERAKKYEHTATIYLYIIIGVLLACILIFAGADRLVGALFKSAAERELEAVLRQSTMQVLHDLSASIEKSQNRNLPRDGSMPPEPASPAEPAPAAKAEVRPRAQAPLPQPPAKPISDPSPSSSSPAFDTPETTRLSAENHDPSADDALRRTIGRLSEENARLLEKLMETRALLSEEADRLPIEDVRKDMAIEVARIRAAAEDYRADADRDVAQAKADVERDVAQDLNALIASSVARVGAAVIVVLLVRIFLRDRQRLILQGNFYVGLADALEISGGDPAQLKVWLLHLAPPALAPSDDVATPVETMMQAAVELAKRNRS